MTIWEALAIKLGRQPTNAEAIEDVKRILSESALDRPITIVLKVDTTPQRVLACKASTK